MSRKTFSTILADGEDAIVGESTKHAFNSTIREPGRMAREYARERWGVLYGAKTWVDPAKDKYKHTRHSRIWQDGFIPGAVTVTIAEDAR